MGVLDEAIRAHLELKRKHGASDEEVAKQEAEALGPARRERPREPAPPAATAAEEAVHDLPPTPMEGPVAVPEERSSPELQEVRPPVDELEATEVRDEAASAPPLAGEPPLDEPPVVGDHPAADEPLDEHSALDEHLALDQDLDETRAHSLDEEAPAPAAGATEPLIDEPAIPPPEPAALEPEPAIPPESVEQEPEPVTDEPEPVAHDLLPDPELPEELDDLAEPAPPLTEAPPAADLATDDPQADPLLDYPTMPHPAPRPDEPVIDERAASGTPPAGFPAVEPDADEEAEDGEDDVLEETPDFLQETPEHDRLWFEQKPPRDFDFDD